MITDKQVEVFIQKGAVVLDDVLEPSLIEAASECMDRHYAPYTEIPTGTLQYIFGESFESIYQHPNFEAIAKKVLGCDKVDFVASAILHTKPNVKEWGYESKSQHVDIQYNEEELCQCPRKIILTFMIFLDDVPAERSPTLIRLGSHLALAKHYGTEIPYRDTPTWLSQLPGLDFAPLTPLTGLKGQVAISTTALIHCASFNATEKARKVMFVSYAPTGSNIRFNADIVKSRLEYMKELHFRFSPERKHLVEGTIAQLEDMMSIQV